MGTHPIFESDFDCLTEYILYINMSEAVNRIRSPIDEFAAKKEDYYLDSGIKIGAGLFVGSVIGLATRKLVRVRYPMLIGGSMGAGMALERYSYQLSAPYTNPPSTPVDPKAPILTNTALPLGALWSAIFPEAKAEPVAEAVAETVAEEPVAAVEEVVEAPAEETTQEAPVEAVVEAVEDVVSEVADVVEEVVEAALDVVQEVRETVAEAAEEVKEVAEEVIQAAVVVEDVSEKIDEIVKIELVEEVEAQAKEVEHVAEEVKEVAAEIVEATKQ